MMLLFDAAEAVVACGNVVVWGRGIGGVQRFCCRQRRRWHAGMLFLFVAAETEVACGVFVTVCSRCGGGMWRFVV